MYTLVPPIGYAKGWSTMTLWIGRAEPQQVPFDPSDPLKRLEHFWNHGQIFGAHTPEEYEAMADTFMTKPKTANMEECYRKPDLDIYCRYDKVTKEYGAMWVADGVVLTYFIPVPGAHIAHGDRPPWMHDKRTNLEYFNARC